MKIFELILLSIIPSIIILTVVYKKDIEKEPLKLLIGLFGVGVICSFLTITLSYMLKMVFPGIYVETNNIIKIIIYCFIFVALLEEAFKWLFSYSITFNSIEFNHLYDSIVYCIFLSLGFATFENILYVLIYGYKIGLMRAITSIPAHTFFGICMGYFFAKAKLSIKLKEKIKSKLYLLLSIIIPVIVHGIYDFCIYNLSLLSIKIYIGLMILIYIYGFLAIKKVSKAKTLVN